MAPVRTNAREKLLNAALRMIREKGYAGTSVDELCAAAGVTKGAFFHHFASKEELAVAAAEVWRGRAAGLLTMEPYRHLTDPVERLLAYVDLRKSLLDGPLPEYTCLLGTMVQETYETHPAIRDACEAGLLEHIDAIEADVREAMRACGVKSEWSARSLAAYTQGVIQGAFILAKAQGSPALARECLDHLRRYIEMLFARPASRRRKRQMRPRASSR